MPLIKCPECLQAVSDQAAACPHCGYPISHLYSAAQAPGICLVNGVKMDLGHLLEKIRQGDFMESVRWFHDNTGCKLREAKRVCDGLKATGEIPQVLTLETVAKGVIEKHYLGTAKGNFLERFAHLFCR